MDFDKTFFKLPPVESLTPNAKLLLIYFFILTEENLSYPISLNRIEFETGIKKDDLAMPMNEIDRFVKWDSGILTLKSSKK